MSTTTKTISKSNKRRSAGKRYQPRQNWPSGEGSRIERNGVLREWKQVVTIEVIGRNKKGKPIHKSTTKHLPQ